MLLHTNDQFQSEKCHQIAQQQRTAVSHKDFHPTPENIEYKKDNQILAQKIDELMTDNRILVQRIDELEKENQSFNKIFGNIYLKS